MLFRRAFLRAFSVSLVHPIDPPLADAELDQNAAWRQELAMNLARALEWWQRSPEESYSRVWILRCALLPETKLMDELLRMTSATWDQQQMALSEQTG